MAWDVMGWVVDDLLYSTLLALRVSGAAPAVAVLVSADRSPSQRVWLVVIAGDAALHSSDGHGPIGAAKSKPQPQSRLPVDAMCRPVAVRSEVCLVAIASSP